MKTGLAVVILTTAVLVVRPQADPRAGDAGPEGAAAADALLLPTSHPRLPSDVSRLWLAPEQPAGRHLETTADAVAAAIKLQARGEHAKALPLLSGPAASQGPLGGYAAYYAAVSQLRLGRASEARRSFQSLGMRPIVGYLIDAAALGEAEADEALDDLAAAVAIYDRLLMEKIASPDEVLMRLGKAANAAGDPAKAREAFARVYYEFALSDLAPAAGAELARLSSAQPMSADERYRLDLGRAQQLYSARQYSAAKGAFETLRGTAPATEY